MTHHLYNLCNLCLSVGLSTPNKISLVIFLTNTVWEITRDNLLGARDIHALQAVEGWTRSFFFKILRLVSRSNIAPVGNLISKSVALVYLDEIMNGIFSPLLLLLHWWQVSSCN